jgi:hypothetical protein
MSFIDIDLIVLFLRYWRMTSANAPLDYAVAVNVSTSLPVAEYGRGSYMGQ